MYNLILIVDRNNYQIIKEIDDSTRIPVDLVAVYEIDAPGISIRGLEAMPIERIGEIRTFGFDLIAGLVDCADMISEIAEKLGFSDRYLNLWQFKQRFFDKKMKMQYLRLQTAQKCRDFEHPALKIGDFTYCINLEILTDISGPKCTIGRFCSLSDRVRVLLGIEHRNDWNTTYPFNAFMEDYAGIEGHPSSKGDIVIGNDVCVGLETLIMSGVTIGDGCVIGAGSVVSGEIPPYSIAAGNPARVIRKRFPEDVIDKLLEMKWWNWPDDIIYDAVPLLQSNNMEALYEYWKRSF